MLTVHRGNRIEVLGARLLELVAGGNRDPLVPDLVIVDTPALGHWLARERAAREGVCANLRTLLPGEFVWRIAREVLDGVPPTPGYAPEVLAWHLDELFATDPPAAPGGALRRWLDGRGDGERHRLAERMAHVYDHYLVYRPDWLRAWEGGQDRHWQARLWRRLVARAGGGHWAAIQHALLTALGGEADCGALPDPIAVLLGGALSPGYLDVLAALARHREVHLFALDPSREFWGDLVSARAIARRARVEDTDGQHFDSGNPLLASLGAERRDFLDRLVELADDDREVHVDVDGPRALALLQRDLLELVDPGEVAPAVLAADDDSIQIHVCHGAMREVEVLRDRLLALFDADQSLDPGEVLVTAPSLEPYRGAIKALFAGGEPPIPVHLQDRAAAARGEAFIALLEVAGGRFERVAVLDLLARPEVHRRFGIAASDLGAIGAAVEQAAIGWARDAAHRESLGVPADEEHGWRLGLDRLLLGHALEPDETLFAGLAPVGAALEPGLLASLVDFVEQLGDLGKRLGGMRPVADWCAELRRTARDFLFDEAAADTREAGLEVAIDHVANAAREAGHRRAVSFAAVRDRLLAALGERSEGPFLGGAVNCCDLQSARGLPFAVICVLGLNDGEFPRGDRDAGLDRSVDRPRRGDRRLRDADRQLLLDAASAARRCLYLGYQGRDPADDSERPPSPALGELIDYLDARLRTVDGAPAHRALVYDHPLQPFSERYFGADSRLFSYSGALCRASLAVRAGSQPTVPLCNGKLPPPEALPGTLDVETLVDFWCSPSRALVAGRLSVRLDGGPRDDAPEEPFVVTGLAAYQLRQRLLERRLRGESQADDRGLMRAEGWLPHGAAGDALLEREGVVVEDFARRLAATRERIGEGRWLAVDLEVAGARLGGRLGPLGDDGLLNWRLGRLRARDRVALWIRHLVLCALAPADVACRSRWLHLDGELDMEPVMAARELLGMLLEERAAGLRTPLPFFPEASTEYARVMRSARRGDPLRAARGKWLKGWNRPGEGDDPYHRLAWRGRDPLADPRFVELARAVADPMLGAS